MGIFLIRVPFWGPSYKDGRTILGTYKGTLTLENCPDVLASGGDRVAVHSDSQPRRLHRASQVSGGDPRKSLGFRV